MSGRTRTLAFARRTEEEGRKTAAKLAEEILQAIANLHGPRGQAPAAGGGGGEGNGNFGEGGEGCCLCRGEGGGGACGGDDALAMSTGLGAVAEGMEDFASGKRGYLGAVGVRAYGREGERGREKSDTMV